MIVIYHANCTDGFTAAWCAWLKYGDSAEYIPAQYGDKPPDVIGQDVLVLDFSYPRQVLVEMRAAARSLRVIDHHKTAQADLEGLDFCTFDMTRSGAGLAWDVLHGGARPLLVDYVEDRDLWRWALQRSREVSAYIAIQPHTFEAWDDLCCAVDAGAPDVADRGAVALRVVEQYVERRKGDVALAIVGGNTVPCVNTTFAHSELIGELAKGHPFAVGWFQRSDGQFIYSLRSRGDFDVSEVARAYGGGGHRAAAGFSVPRMIHEPAPSTEGSEGE